MHFISVRIQFLTEIKNKIRHEDIRDYMNLVEEKQKGKTILLVSHNENDISYICDKIYEIDGGGILLI